MERIEQPKTAVPLEVQRVLDAMTDENWRQDGWFDRADGRACFMHRAVLVDGRDLPTMLPGGVHHSCQYDDLLNDNPVFVRLNKLCVSAYSRDVETLNDRSSSLSDFKSKIIALYATEGE